MVAQIPASPRPRGVCLWKLPGSSRAESAARPCLGYSTDSSYALNGRRSDGRLWACTGRWNFHEILWRLIEIPRRASSSSSVHSVPSHPLCGFAQFANDEARIRDPECLGCRVERRGTSWLVTPPSWRADLREEVDLAEEVLRVSGINLPASAQPAVVDPQAGRNPHQNVRERLRELLVGQGYCEAIHYSFAPRGVDAAFGNAGGQAAIANPISEQGAVLRTTLVSSLAAAAARAEAHLGAAAPVRLFEIGHVFHPEQQGNVGEREQLAIWISGTDPFLQPGHSSRVGIADQRRSGFWRRVCT